MYLLMKYAEKKNVFFFVIKCVVDHSNPINHPRDHDCLVNKQKNLHRLIEKVIKWVMELAVDCDSYFLV